MHTIMSLFIFQNSRRQLLALLIRESESASSQREEHAQRGKNESADEQKRIDNVLQAVKAAEEQVKKLEFWSDVRDLTRDGQLYEVAEFKDEWEHNWQVQDTSEPAPVGKYGLLSATTKTTIWWTTKLASTKIGLMMIDKRQSIRARERLGKNDAVVGQSD